MPIREQVLSVLDERRVASISQLAALVSTSPAMVRRWVRRLVSERKIVLHAGLRYPRRVGRAERWISPRNYRGNASSHDWHVTEFAAQLADLRKRSSDLELSFLPGRFAEMVPDLGFAISNQSIGKSLLFFLEMDCGTEPAIRNSIGTDIRQKFARYLEIRAEGRYLNALVGSTFRCRGFRLLFMAQSAARRERISALARSCPGTFIWLSSWDRLQTQGIAGRIWDRGGVTGAPESIFGTWANQLLTTEVKQ